MKRQYSPEEELLAPKLAYHGIGKYIEHEEESAKYKGCMEGFDKQKEKIAAKIMRIAYRRGEEIQKELKTSGEEIKRNVVLALEKNPLLCNDIAGHFFNNGKETVEREDINWLLEFAKNNGIIK